MKRCYLFILAGVASATILLTSCCTVEPVTDFDDLIDRLRQAGAEVEITVDTVRNLHLSVDGVIIVVDGEEVQVFEYEDIDRTQLEFKGVTSSPSVVVFEEGEPPLVERIPLNRQCYHSGRFILLYDGEDEAVLKILRMIVGCPYDYL
jgi:hypothetical protein